LRARGVGEVVGAERGVPDAVEVVLRFAEIEREGVVPDCLLIRRVAVLFKKNTTDHVTVCQDDRRRC
jgi:hypothetical protein